MVTVFDVVREEASGCRTASLLGTNREETIFFACVNMLIQTRGTDHWEAETPFKKKNKKNTIQKMTPSARELCLGPFLNGIADPRASLGFKFFKISV